jgi:hypothetical protein
MCCWWIEIKQVLCFSVWNPLQRVSCFWNSWKIVFFVTNLDRNVNKFCRLLISIFNSELVILWTSEAVGGLKYIRSSGVVSSITHIWTLFKEQNPRKNYLCDHQMIIRFKKEIYNRPIKILSFYYSWKFGQYLEVFEDKQVQGRWPEGSLPKGLALWWAAICNKKIFKILKLLYLFNRLMEFFSCTVIFGWNPIFRANPHSNVTS